MGEAASRVSLTASGQSQSIEGTICITASEVYSAHLLPPVVARLRQEAPGIEIEIVASNQVRDLKRREADIALRNTRPDATGSDRAKAEGRNRTALCHAELPWPSRRGSGVADLSGADFIGFDRNDVLLKGLNSMGFSLTQGNFPVFCGSHLVQWELVKAGVGIGVMPSAIGDAEPLVQRVLPDLDPIVFPMWLIAHRELRTSRRVRLVFDMLAEALM